MLWEKTRQRIPNYLSYARLASPFYLPPIALHGPSRLLLPLMVALALTDLLDGYLARRWKSESKSGAMLDMLGDKVLSYAVGSILILSYGWQWWYVIPFATFILYDAFTISLRIRGLIFAPSNVAKVKTAMMFVALTSVVAPLSWPELAYLWFAGHALLWLTTLFILWSMFRYLNLAPDIPLPASRKIA